MIWWLVTLGVFLVILGAMFVPDWIRWARWNSERRKLPEHKARRFRPPPVAAPFWSSYGGHGAGGGPGDAGDGGAGFGAGAGFDGGGDGGAD